ncbi:MAG: zf-HC2 domain-containing protein [Thermoanaerobaculia bacterium]
MPRRDTRPHLDYQELLFLEPDGELTRPERRQLDEHVARCGECAATRREVASLGSMLENARIEPDPDLARRVLENLPPADWEMRRPANWRGAAAAFIGLVIASYALTFQGQPMGEALSWIETLSAIAGLFGSAVLAGAGLLSASWAGVGLALGEVLSRSPVGFVVFGLFVLGVDALFLRYLWRLSRRASDASLSRRDGSG